jgi:hypothetical protein
LLHRTFHLARPPRSVGKRAGKAPVPFSGKSGNAGCSRQPGVVLTGSSFTVDEFDELTKANMDIVLDEICAELPHGGDHDSRKFIAEQLMQAARAGKTTLNELTYVGRRALVQFQNRPKLA